MPYAGSTVARFSCRLFACVVALALLALAGVGKTEAQAPCGAPPCPQQGMAGGMGAMGGSSPGMGHGMMGGMGPGMMWGHGWMGHGRSPSGFMAGCFMITGENGAFGSLDARFMFLRTNIGITDAQAQKWAAYENAVKNSLTATEAAWRTMMENLMSLDFAERFRRQLEALNAHLASLQQVLPALAEVYATLTPEQRMRADGLFRSMGCLI